ncbi:hypothetical protein CNYM01_13821 [Colletotrichum nymphaeae SA-01]|uniref:Uncharacterized protein n=1 Tax=Colletotrichum nymphaeae SA-01 TaxID=1460502 RepID=A0A135T229_9PEZI|nr:hypothetical protein CNYM01_13821 [Colletotrichum nymphaeae SA-01]
MPILDPSPQLITGVMLTTGPGLGLTLSSTYSPILANHVVRVLFLLEQQHRHHTQFLRGRKGRATHAYWGVPVAACATRLDESRGEQQSRKRRAAPLHPACPLGSELFPSNSSRKPLWRAAPRQASNRNAPREQ